MIGEVFSEIPCQTPDDNHKVVSTLKLVVEIVNEMQMPYRIWGSVIPAAILGRLYRPLGDIDILIAEENLKQFVGKLQSKNFALEKRDIGILNFHFSWMEARKQNSTPLTIFYGKFDSKQNFIFYLNRNSTLVVEANSIKPTKYSLFGVQFLGIPPETSYCGIYRSRFNPKRRHELAIMQTVLSLSRLSCKPEAKLFYKDNQVPFFTLLYTLLQALRNVIGTMRVALGMKYDFW